MSGDKANKDRRVFNKADTRAWLVNSTFDETLKVKDSVCIKCKLTLTKHVINITKSAALDGVSKKKIFEC